MIISYLVVPKVQKNAKQMSFMDKWFALSIILTNSPLINMTK
jgi:hypothetical protein